jgi:hypothetical protein
MVGMEVRYALSTSFYEGGLQFVMPKFSFIQKHSKQTDFTLPFRVQKCIDQTKFGTRIGQGKMQVSCDL